MRLFLYFFIAAIFMTANDAFFTWVGMFTGLAFWRQLIWLIGMYIVYYVMKKRSDVDPLIVQIYRKYKKLFVFIIFFAVITILINGFNLVRIMYTLIEYSYGLPFLLFPFVCRKCGWGISKVNYLFIILGTFLTTGLLVDYMSGGLITTAFVLAVSQGVEQFGNGRYNFLSTSNSIMTVYYSLCLMCCFYEYHRTKNFFSKYLLLLLTIYFIFGSVFTGARQTLVGLILVEVIGFWSILKSGNKSFFFMVAMLIIFVSIALPSAQNLLSDNSGFEKRYSADAVSEDDRTETWKRGFRETFIDTSIRRLTIGDGVGLATGQKANQNETVGPHYENTFFARISEIGLIAGLASLLIPVFFLMKKRGLVLYQLHLGVIFSFLFISCVSPNGATNQTQMALFILLGMYIEDYRQRQYGQKFISQ